MACAASTCTIGAAALQTGLHVLTSIVVPVAVLAATALLGTVVGRRAPSLWLAVPVLAVAAVSYLNLVTEDTSAGAAVCVLYPVIYAASQLRAGPAWGCTALAVAGHTLVVSRLLPPIEAATNALYVDIAAVSLAALFVYSGRRQDELLARLEQRAAVDSLTGLVNRRVLDEAVKAALTHSDCDAGTAMVLVDLDHFKKINDTLGHPVGDEVLVHVGQQLLSCVRHGDVVSRMGGDELAVLMPGTSRADALHAAHRMLERLLADPVQVEGHSVELSASIGVAHSPEHGSTPRELYAAADAALYRAKRAGRARVRVEPVPDLTAQTS
ncbi:hypothetical protein GCM10028814_06320 [Angustibacter aerolatus]